MAKQIQKEIQRGVESWISLGNRRPHLSIILVGDNPASHTYVRKKIRAASAVGGDAFSLFLLLNHVFWKYHTSNVIIINDNCQISAIRITFTVFNYYC